MTLITLKNTTIHGIDNAMDRKTMKFFTAALSMLLLFVGACSLDGTSELIDLLDRVETQNVGRNTYILGKALTGKQKEIARGNPVEIENRRLYKFKDGDLFIVAEKTTHRVIVLYELYDPASRKQIQEIVGSLFLDFGAPTLLAHDKIIYWTYGPSGKLSEQDYNKAKEEKEKIKNLATVKLTSSLKIMEKEDPTATGNVYIIISSQPVMNLIAEKQEN